MKPGTVIPVDIIERPLWTAVYSPNPEHTEEAIRVAERWKQAHPGEVTDAIWAYLACACGRRHSSARRKAFTTAARAFLARRMRW